MDVSSVAALATGLKQGEIGQAVAIKVAKLANEQQKSVLSLLDAALQGAAQAQEAGKGQHIDVSA